FAGYPRPVLAYKGKFGYSATGIACHVGPEVRRFHAGSQQSATKRATTRSIRINPGFGVAPFQCVAHNDCFAKFHCILLFQQCPIRTPDSRHTLAVPFGTNSRIMSIKSDNSSSVSLGRSGRRVNQGLSVGIGDRLSWAWLSACVMPFHVAIMATRYVAIRIQAVAFVCSVLL